MERCLAHKILRDSVSLHKQEVNKAVQTATQRIWGREWWKWLRDIEKGSWPLNEDCGCTMRSLFDIVLEGVYYISDVREREPLYPIIDYFCRNRAYSSMPWSSEQYGIIMERVPDDLQERLAYMTIVRPDNHNRVRLSYSRYGIELPLK